MALYDITALGSAVEFDTSNFRPAESVKLTATRVCSVWVGGSNALIQCFSYDAGTGATAAESSPVILEAGENAHTVSICKVDDTHVIAMWRSQFNNVVWAKMYTVNSGTGALTATGSAVDVGGGSGMTGNVAVTLIDATHVCFTWLTSGTTATKMRVYLINTSTGAMTTAGAEYSTTTWVEMQWKLLDSTHLIGVGRENADDLYVKIVAVNTSTWALTQTTMTAIVTGITTNEAGFVLLKSGSTSYFCAIYTNSSGGTTGTLLQSFSVNGSYAVSAINNLQLSTLTSQLQSVLNSLVRISDTHFIGFFRGDANDGFARVWSHADGASLTQVSELEFDTADSGCNNTMAMDLTGNPRFVNMWAGVATDGFIRAFEVSLSVSVSTSVSTQALTFSIPAYVASGNYTHAQPTLSMTFSIPIYSISTQGNMSINLPTLSMTFTVPAYVVTAIENVSTSVPTLDLTFSTITPAITAIRNISIEPSTQLVTMNFVTRAFQGGVWRKTRYPADSWTKQELETE